MDLEQIFNVADKIIDLMADHGCDYWDAKEIFEKVDIKLMHQSVRPSETESL